jgi:hypothetical protein
MIDTARPLHLHDHHTKTLHAQLVRARRSMLWAIHDRDADRAADCAKKSARYVRLIFQRIDKYGWC